MTIPQEIEQAFQLQQTGQFDQAERLCREVLAREPANPNALQLMAGGKFLRGQHAEAFEIIRTALSYQPDHVENTVLAAHCLRALGKLSEAAEYYLRAVAMVPDIGILRVMTGSTLRGLGRIAEARAQYTMVGPGDPAFAEAQNNIAVLHHDVGELEPAIAIYRQTLALKPNYVEARQNLATALRSLGHIEEALAEFEAILTTDPHHAYATLMVAHTKRELCDWRDYPALTANVARLAETHAAEVSPTLFVSWPLTLADLLKVAGAYAGRYAAIPVLPAAPAKRTGTKLRIGYVSPDFREHVVSTVVAPVFAAHDRARFDIIAYSYGPDDGGPYRQRVAAACTAFNDVRTLSDEEIAHKIRADEIDVLVDLAGYSGAARHGIMIRRPAPVQMFWLGYPCSTGSPAIDYIVADAFTVPPTAETFYSERIIRFPGPSQPHDTALTAADPLPRAHYGLPENAFVFCSFNHPQKITPEIFNAWREILISVPGSVLWLRADREAVHENLRRETKAAGIDPDRLVFAPRTPGIAAHLARYHIADLALDTFPHNSHTTANDALWQGCPLVTLAGEPFAARLAGSMLKTLGLEDLIATTFATYRDIAVKLAQTPGALSDVKARLIAGRPHALQFDVPRFTRYLEAAYAEAWRIHAGSEPRRHITVAE